MTTALVSLLTGRRVRHDVAMTGEITLQGRVLPIGGLKQKVLAAHRGGIRQVIFPLRNEHDLDDVPESVRADMTFHPVDQVGPVIELASGAGGGSDPSRLTVRALSPFLRGWVTVSRTLQPRKNGLGPSGFRSCVTGLSLGLFSHARTAGSRPASVLA